jgi:hypothetical protein
MAYNPPVVWAEVFIDLAGFDWIDLRDVDVELTAFTVKRGRQDRLGVFEPGSASLTLSDPTFSVYAEASAALIPVRILATWNDGSTTHTAVVIWQGFLDDGVQAASTSQSRSRYLAATATDLLGWANNRPMPESQWATWIAHESPDHWWRGYANAGTDGFTGAAEYTLFDYVDGNDLDEVVSGNYEERDPLVLTGTVPSLLMGAGDRLGSASAVGDLGTGHSWTVAFAFQLDDISGAGEDCWLLVGRSTSVSGDLRWGIRVEDASGEIQAEIRDSSNTVIGTATTAVAPRHDDGEPHVIIARFNVDIGGNRIIRIHTDLDAQSDSATLSGTPRGSGGFIVTGNTSATNPAKYLSEIAYWDDDISLPDTSMTPVLAAFIAGSGQPETFGLWHNQDTTTRLTALLTAGEAATVQGLTTDTEVHDSGTFTWFGLLPKATLGSYIQTLGSSVLGAAYILRDGTLRIRDVDALTDAGLAANYATLQAYISDDPTEAGTPVVRYQARSGLARRVDRVVNEAHIQTADGYTAFTNRTFRRINLASIQQWGPHPLNISTEAFYADLDALDDALDDILEPDPPLEIGQVVIRPWGDVALTTFCLLDCELEKAINYRESDPDGLSVVDASYRVQGEEWSWSLGVDWTVTLTISPI